MKACLAFFGNNGRNHRKKKIIDKLLKICQINKDWKVL